MGQFPNVAWFTNAGTVRLVWPLGLPGWSLQTTTNAASLNWVTWQAQCECGASALVTNAEQYFRRAQ